MISPVQIAAIRKAVEKNPQALLSLSDEDQIAAARAIVGAEDERYARDPWAWATERVRTMDEASSQVLDFPEKDYLQDLFQILDEEQKIAIPKSRRKFITWGVSTWILHRVRYRKHVAAFIQSETEGKAAFVIDKRMAFIENNLDPIYRRPFTQNKTTEGLIGKMTYVQTGSYAKALAQGGDAFRTFTPTIIFLDELEFQQQGHQSFVASLPFAEKNCKLIICSSSNGPHGVLADMARGCGFTRFKV